MKNHFFFAYSGNKRSEVEQIVNHIDLNGIGTIIEPFCGTCAFSYYISTLYPKKYKYILNDYNKYIVELLNIARDKDKLKKLNDDIKNICFKNDVFIDKETYKKETYNKKTLLSYIISNKYFTIRSGLYPKYPTNVKNNLNLEDCPIVKFLRDEDVEISGVDGIEIIEEFKNFDDCFIFLDPPYMLSMNSFYNEEFTENNKHKKYLNVYEYLYNNNIKKFNSNIFLVLEDIWIVRLLFDQFKNNFIQYKKKYQTSKRDSYHLLIKNK